jgi:hypothetical protein
MEEENRDGRNKRKTTLVDIILAIGTLYQASGFRGLKPFSSANFSKKLRLFVDAITKKKF